MPQQQTSARKPTAQEKERLAFIPGGCTHRQHMLQVTLKIYRFKQARSLVHPPEAQPLARPLARRLPGALFPGWHSRLAGKIICPGTAVAGNPIRRCGASIVPDSRLRVVLLAAVLLLAGHLVAGLTAPMSGLLEAV